MSWLSIRWKLATFVLAILPVWIYFAPLLAERLVVTRPLDRADVIFVLAGSAAYVTRTRTAAVLYKKGIAPMVLLTNDGRHGGWSRTEQRNPLYVELAQQELIVNGVPKDAIEILRPRISATIMEAALVAKVATERQWRSILIVTSPYHTRRALWTFDNVFAEKGLATQIGIVPALAGQQTPPASYWWLTATGWRDVAGEYVKSAYYHFAY